MHPLALSRRQAAQSLAIGVTLFDRLVRQGVLPPPVRLGGRTVWCTRALRRAFDAAQGAPAPPPDDDTNEWDSVL
jgi:predicted DNA-binding transcriptional regulator AlpA